MFGTLKFVVPAEQDCEAMQSLRGELHMIEWHLRSLVAGGREEDGLTEMLKDVASLAPQVIGNDKRPVQALMRNATGQSKAGAPGSATVDQSVAATAAPSLNQASDERRTHPAPYLVWRLD